MAKDYTIRTRIYEQLRDAICQGEYEPGQRLQEMELVERFGVSRSPIREALRLLVSDGLVDEIPNRGVFVRSYTPQDIKDIFELRVLFEGYAIDMLRTKLTQDNMDELMQILERMEFAFERADVRAYMATDRLLHHRIIELCGNSLMLQLYQRIEGQIGRFRQDSVLRPQRFQDSMQEHRDLVRNLIAGNSLMAKEVNLEHLTHARDSAILCVSRQ